VSLDNFTLIGQTCLWKKCGFRADFADLGQKELIKVNLLKFWYNFQNFAEKEK